MLNEINFIDKIRNSPFAWWEWDIRKNKVVFNDLKVTMLGYEPAEFVHGGFEVFTKLLHPEDLKKGMDAMYRVLRRETSLYQVDYRILSKSSDYRWYMDRGSVVEYSDSGSPLRLRGVVIDLGKESEAGASEEALINLMNSSVLISDNKNIFVMTICSNCGNAKINTDTWIDITEDLMNTMSDELSHGICPKCLHILYPEIADEVIKNLHDEK